MKKVLIIRYGGLGDFIIASPLFKRLKQDEYEVTLNTVDRGFPIIKNNPYIDKILLQEDNLIPRERLGDYWDAISEGYDKVVNLSETLEVKFLFHPKHDEFRLPIEERRRLSGGANYYDYVLHHAGYTDIEAPIGELYPDDMEKMMIQNFRNKFHGQFLILWCLSGSAMHKAWLRAEEAAITFLARHKDVIIITIGDYFTKLIDFAQWAPPGRVLSQVGEWDIRTSMLMTNYVDLVVSPETSILNAAGCYATPKIGLLTHSNKTNLTKYFKNDYSLQAETDCSPCHRMIYMDNFKTDCPLLGGGKEKIGFDTCACADGFSVDKVLKNIEKIYQAWKSKNNTLHFIKPEKPIVLYGPAGQKVYQANVSLQ
jgi:ADP-heptose:LPS heptosyltransferase